MTQNPEKSSKSRVKIPDLDDSLYTNQLNNSRSKQLYSVPRQPRWKEPKKSANEPQLYSLPSTISKRSASFGYGNKLDISKLANPAPPPNSYMAKSQFDIKNKGIGMGLGRSNIKAVSTFGEKPFIVPGVGSYAIKEPKSHQTVSFSSRTVDLSEKWIRQVPGPGTYETLELLDKNLKSLNSRFSNGRSQRFSKNDGRNDFQHNLKKQNIPGPGQYASQKKSYDIIDRFMQHKGGSFSKSTRPDIANKSGFPGPGSYKNLSEFIH